MSIHDFRPRILLTKTFARFCFTVLRIICHFSKELRKRTGEEIQYTLTILPPFIGPFARISLETLFAAFSRLAGGASRDDVAGLVSKAADTRPLNRYLSRFLKRAPGWTVRLCQWLIQSGVVLPTPEISRHGMENADMTAIWDLFISLAKTFCQNHERTTAGSVILAHLQAVFVHARLSYSGMDLGP